MYPQQPASSALQISQLKPVGKGRSRDVPERIVDSAIILMLVPRRLLQLPIPRSWARIGSAAAEFKRFMMDMLDEETTLLQKGEAGTRTGSLMISFVRALDTHQNEEEAALKSNEGLPSKGVTVEEVLGNIFVISFAGHDTTANTLAFSKSYL